MSFEKREHKRVARERFWIVEGEKGEPLPRFCLFHFPSRTPPKRHKRRQETTRDESFKLYKFPSERQVSVRYTFPFSIIPYIVLNRILKIVISLIIDIGQCTLIENSRDISTLVSDYDKNYSNIQLLAPILLTTHFCLVEKVCSRASWRQCNKCIVLYCVCLEF